MSVSTSRSATFRCELPSVVYSARDITYSLARVSSASARRGGGVAARFSAQNRTQRPYASEAKSSAALVRTTTGVSWRASNPSRHMESAMACACSRLTPVCSRFVPSGTTSRQRTRRTRGESAYAASRRFSSSTVARAASRPSRAGARGVSRDAMTGAPRLGARRPNSTAGPRPEKCALPDDADFVEGARVSERATHRAYEEETITCFSSDRGARARDGRVRPTARGSSTDDRGRGAAASSPAADGAASRRSSRRAGGSRAPRHGARSASGRGRAPPRVRQTTATASGPETPTRL